MRTPKKKGRRKPSPRKQVQRDVDAFLVSQEADHAADYANRGRIHKHLTDQQLAEKWIAAYRHLAEAPRESSRRAIETDLRAEFKLRNIELPLDQVQAELDRISSSLASSIETMKRDDPERFAEINRELERDIADVKARMKQSN